MRTLALTAILAAAALSLTACGSGDGQSKAAPASTWSNPGAIPATPQKLTLGQAAMVLGTDDVQMRVTPTAVLYDRGPYNSGLDGPENGWYIAIAVKAEAIDQPGTTAGGAGGGGFEWRGSGQTITAMDGNTSASPWIGAVPELTVDEPIEVGDPREGIETFDIPAKGGRLVYLNPEDSSITATWDLPTAEQGSTPALVKVRKRIKLFR